MTNYSNEGGSNFDGDWENGDISWTEAQWQAYLRRMEAEQQRFLGFFSRLKHQPDHLDDIARKMGWHTDIWPPAEGFEMELVYTDDPEEANDEEPYTVHRHPVYAVTRALYAHIQSVWERFLAAQLPVLSASQISEFSRALQRGEVNSVMALNALDMGDFNLAVCHLKAGLSDLNATMAALQKLPARTPEHQEAFQSEIFLCLFDLREVWLRVMAECRNEARFDQDSDE